MASQQVVAVSFTGAEDFIDITWTTTLGSGFILQCGMISAAGIPTVRIALTNRTAAGVRVTPSVRFTGTVVVIGTPPGVAASGGPVAPSASRSTGAQGYADGGSTPLRETTIPIPVPSDIGAGLSVTFSNQSAAYPNTAHGASISNFNVSVYEGTISSGHPVPTGSSLATWTNQTIPGSGGVWTSPTTFDGTGHGVAKYLIVVIGNPASTHMNIAAGITTGTALDGSSTTDPYAAGGSNQNNATGTCRITGISTTRHRVVVMGDSQANAYSSPGTYTPFREQSAFVKIGPDNDWAVDTLGIAGMTLAQGSSLAFFSTGVVVGNAILYTNLSINSLPVWANLAAAQTDYASFITWAQSLGFTKIVLSTLPPSGAYPDSTYGTLRNAVNGWMLGGVTGVTAVVDADLVLRDPADHTQLLASYRQADNTHFLAAGHTALATQITTVLSPLF